MPPASNGSQAPRSPASAADESAAGSALGTLVAVPVEPGAAAGVTTFGLSTWTVARSTLVVVLVLGGLYLLWKIQEVLLLLLLAVLFATAIEPVVNRLRRGPFSRAQGVLIVYSGLFLVLAALGFILVPTLLDQATRFVDAIPREIAALHPRVEAIQLTPLRGALLRVMDDVAPTVQRSIVEPDVAAVPEQLVGVGSAFASTLISIITVFLLAYYWLAERVIIKRAVLRLVPPDRARQVNATWLEVESKLGAWVRGQLLVMFAIGVMAGLAFVVLGLPNPLLLAVLASLFEIIPIVGPFLAFIPALLVALTVDPTKALLLLPIAIVIQQIEGSFLVPRIMSHLVGISPLTVILGILIGSILYGPAGAFIAVPVAAAIQVILNNTLSPALEEDTPRVPVPPAELEGDRVPAGRGRSG
jgi:predicted PurR-regulated permease PerM